MPNASIIQQNAVSFETIKAALDAYIKSQAPGLRWLDFFESGPGTIIEELMAGLGAFKSFAELDGRVEATLDFARLLSSVYELAFNRGFLVPPSQAAQITLYLVPNVNITVAQADLVGTIGNYNIYSLENKTMPSGVPAYLDSVVGYIDSPENWTVNVTSSQPFSTIVVDLNNKNVAKQLELLSNGSQIITLVDDIISPGASQRSIPLDTISGLSDPQILNLIHTLLASTSSNPDIYVLRRARPNQVRIYLGNGTLGFYDPTVTQLTYRRLTYNDDVNNILSNVPLISLNAALASFSIDNQAEFLPGIESVRGVARFYPIDGRVVQDGDYSRVILKYYSAFLYDAFAYYLDWPLDMPTQTFQPGSVDTVNNLINFVGNPFSSSFGDWAVRYETTGSPIGGLTPGTIYWVVNQTANTFQISAIQDGPAIPLTSQGTGTYVLTDPETEVVNILSNPFFTTSILNQIKLLISSRAAQGIQVTYNQIPSSTGVVLSPTFITLPGELTPALFDQAIKYLNSLILKFITTATKFATGTVTVPPGVTLVRLCIQLASQLGIEILPGDSNSITLEPGEFIQAINPTWTIFQS